MNVKDEALQRSLPTVAMPKFEVVAAMEGCGERLIVGSNGVFLEIRRPWIRLVRRVASYSVQTAVPYGAVEQVTQLYSGPVPGELIQAFQRLAQHACPNETGAWIVWDSADRRYRLVELDALSSGPGHLKYRRPMLSSTESLVVDCHSHGRLSAYFSATDNGDDQYDVKFAFVVGTCDTTPTFALRLCAKGLFEELSGIPDAWMPIERAEVVSW